MSAIAYMKRAVNRAVQKGPLDMLEYSFHIIWKRVRGAMLDLKYGSRISRTDHGWAYNPQGRYANVPTDVYAMDAIFERLTISPEDVLVDVGCGDGRAIAYFLDRGVKNKIVGIELLPDAAERARKRFAKYQNVEIICGDATTAETDGTVFFLYNPFEAPQAKKFESQIRSKPVKVVYYNFMHLDAFPPEHWNIEVVKNTKPDYRQYMFALIMAKRS